MGIDWRQKVSDGIGAAIVTLFVLLVVFAVVGLGTVVHLIGERV